MPGDAYVIGGPLEVVRHGATPPAPDTANQRLYPKTNGRWYTMAADGIEHSLASPDWLIAVIAASQTAVIGWWYRCTAAITITLPAAPPDGSSLRIENTSTGVVSYLRGGTVDTIEGSTTALSLAAGDRITLYYQASTATWFMERETSAATPGTALRRDSAGRAQVVDPAAAADIATKNYVDTIQLGAAVNPAVVAVGTTSTYLTPATRITAGSAAVGDTWRFLIALSNTASIQTLSLQIRVGTAGTTADTATAGPTLTAGSVATAGQGLLEVVASVRSTGATGVLVFACRWMSATGMSATTTATSYGTATLNTTVDQYVGVSATSTVASVIASQLATAETVRNV